VTALTVTTAASNVGGVVSAAINPPKSAENHQQSALDAWFAEQDKRPLETISAPGVVNASGYYIQVGAYAIRANAEATLVHLKERLVNRLPDFDIVQQGNLYRLITGPFKSRNEASSLIAENKELNTVKALVIQR
jgi:cell division septation protein DedD